MQKATPFDFSGTEDFLTQVATAKMLGMSERHLLRMHAERRGPPVIKIGRKIYYHKASVVAWLLSPSPARDLGHGKSGPKVDRGNSRRIRRRSVWWDVHGRCSSRSRLQS